MEDFIPVSGFGKRKYFSFEERKALEKMLSEGVSARSCAEILGRSKSAVAEESKRKPPYDRYRAEWAHRDFLAKQRNKGNVRKLDSDPALRRAVLT